MDKTNKNSKRTDEQKQGSTTRSASDGSDEQQAKRVKLYDSGSTSRECWSKIIGDTKKKS